MKKALILFAFVVFANIQRSKATVNVTSFVINSDYLQNGEIYVNPATGREIKWGVELTRSTLPGPAFVYEDGNCTITLVMYTNQGYINISEPIKITEASWKSSGDNVSRGVTTTSTLALIPSRSTYGSLYVRINRYNTQNKVWEEVYTATRFPITTTISRSLPASMKQYILGNTGLPDIPSTKFYPDNVKPILTVGQNVYSPNRQYYLTIQTDGNLVLYRADGVAVWHSATNNTSPVPAKSLFFQSDGNLVLYQGMNYDTVPNWASTRCAHKGETVYDNAYYALQDDGNFVFYFTYSSSGANMCYVIANTGSNNRISTHPGTLGN